MNKWISVDDELPEVGTWVLGASKSAYGLVRCYADSAPEGRHLSRITGADWEEEYPDYWMLIPPLPQPPEVDDA